MFLFKLECGLLNDEGNKYLFELIWNVRSKLNLDEFHIRDFNQSLNELLNSLEFVSDLSNSQIGNKMESNFELFNISSELVINENVILITSKSVYNNIPVEETEEVLKPSELIRLSGDPERFVKFTSANSMVNSFIFNILNKIISHQFGSSQILQLMSTTLSTLQGAKQNANRL